MLTSHPNMANQSLENTSEIAPLRIEADDCGVRTSPEEGSPHVPSTCRLLGLQLSQFRCRVA